MTEQSAANHAHRPRPTQIAALLWLAATLSFLGTILLGWDLRDVTTGWLLATAIVLIGIGRIYTTNLQDRIIRLEMKVRCAEVLPAGDDAKLAGLTNKQVAALRFASDAELGPLLDRAIRERLAPRDIKQAVKTWTPDLHRT